MLIVRIEPIIQKEFAIDFGRYKGSVLRLIETYVLRVIKINVTPNRNLMEIKFLKDKCIKTQLLNLVNVSHIWS